MNAIQNNTRRATCVLRPVNGIDQYVEVGKSTIFARGENLYTGYFRFVSEKCGPSNSHEVFFGEPVGELHCEPVRECVLRERAPGRGVWHENGRPDTSRGCFDFVEAKSVPRIDGEPVFVGIFRAEPGVKGGPYGSHTKTIQNPLYFNEAAEEESELRV